MLSNVLSLLVFWVRRNSTNPEMPMFFTQNYGEDVYQIIVQKMPKQEAIAA